MNDNNSTQKLYDALKKEGYSDLGEFNEFEGKLKDSGKREKLYGVLKNDGFSDIGTISDFNAKLGYPDPVPELSTDKDATQPVQKMHELEQPQQPEEKEGFWDSYMGDLIEKFGVGLSNMGTASGSLMDKLSKAYAPVKNSPIGNAATNILRTMPGLGGIIGALDVTHTAEKVSPDIFKEMSNASQSVGNTLREKSDRYNGKTFVDLWKEGDYKGVAGDIFLQATESLPQSIAAMFGGGVGLAATGVLAGTLKYDELDENTDMGEVAKITNAVLTGSFEALSEKLGDVPIGKWLKGLYGKMGKEAAEQTLQKGFSGWLQQQFKNYGVLLAPVAEGTEEIASQIAENITDRITGADPDKPITDGLLESFVYGAGGGAQFSMGAIPGLAHRGYQKAKTSSDWRKSKDEFNKQFAGDNTVGNFVEGINAMQPEEQKQVLTSLLADGSLSQEQEDAAVNLVKANNEYRAYRTPEAIKQDREARQELQVDMAMRNLDAQYGSLVNENGYIQRVIIDGNGDSPVNIIRGSVMCDTGDDGKMHVDKNSSSPELYYTDVDGNVQVTTPNNVTNVISIVGYQDMRSQYETAIRQQFAPVEQSNEVTADDVISNGDQVAYVDEKGNTVTGIVVDAFSSPEYVMLEDGQMIPRGLATRTDVLQQQQGTTIPAGEGQLTNSVNPIQPYTPEVNPVDAQQVIADQSLAENNETKENAIINEEVPGAEENKVSFMSQIPVQNGSMAFDQAPAETTLSALQEVYDDPSELNEVISSTIVNIQKQIEKASKPKITGDISKDIANKQKSRQDMAGLQNRMNYWKGVQDMHTQSQVQTVPSVKDQVTEQLTGGNMSAKTEQPTIIKKPSKPTPFQVRLSKIAEQVHTVRDNILFGIASGTYKLSWSDKPGSRGLGAELGLSSSPTERRIRIGILSNAGYTPEQLAHRIWEDSGREVDDTEVRNEVLDVLSSVTSRAQALEALEARTGISEEQYYAEQEELSAYEQEADRINDERYNEIESQLIEDDFLHLWEIAKGQGVTDSDMSEAYTALDVIDILEQTAYAREQEQSNNEGILHEENETVNSEGNINQRTDGTVSERDGSTEGSISGTQIEKSEVDGRIDNLSPEEERIVDEVNTQLDAEISVVENHLNDLSKEEKAARKRLSKAQANTQGDLFGLPQSGDLFEVPADLSKRNVVDAILKPLQDKISFTEGELADLYSQRERRIRKALDASRSQQGIDFENATAIEVAGLIAQREAIREAEVDTNTNPTEAQKEAGNYKKGHVTIQGFDISIEQPKGSVRTGVDENGKAWSQVMNNTYGYFRGTESRDGDHIDVFVGLIPESRNVFVVDQVKPNTGEFDEHKVMLGFDSIEDAKAAYLSNYEEGWQGLSNITGVDIEDFRKWTKIDGRRVKPFSEYKQVKEGETIKETPSDTYGENNTLISKEKYEELKRQMRAKLNGLNVGFDPELFTIGTQMAMYHIEAGARKFADFSRNMIDDLGNEVRPYLKSFYESARNAPGMERLSKEMDAYKEVTDFDVDNFDENVIFTESKDINHETDSDNRGNNSTPDDGRVSTRTVVEDVQRGTPSPQREDRGQGNESPSLERRSIEPGRKTGGSTGDNADIPGAGLRTSGTETNSDNGRNNSGDTNESGKPLNRNNNRQERGESVVPKGNAAKISANIAAIKLAKRLRDSGKKATPTQMEVLRKYTGWGGLSSVFQPTDKNYQTLKDVLTEDEYDSARASTTTAFYTPQEITSSVWDIIEKLGFKGGNILEPSAGIGNFFALMPENISNNSILRGVELDDISGSILKLLYPDAQINISGYEKQRIPNNSIDLVVSNVPFGNFKVYDANEKDISNQFDIHDYFIAKSIRKLKPGGIGVFITTSSTLDKSAALRNWVINSGNSDFIDAVRLNTDTFKNDAGTEATADIIIIRKRDEKGRSPYEKNMQDSVVAREGIYKQEERNAWGGYAGEVDKTARMTFNKYFVDNSGRMAGEMKFGFEGGNSLRPTEQRLAPVKDVEQQDVINRMIEQLPKDIYNVSLSNQAYALKSILNDGTKEGGLTIIDGKPYIVSYGTPIAVDWNENKVAGRPKMEVLQDYLDIKNTINELLDLENSNGSEAEMKTLRIQLNKQYDSFVSKYGPLNDNRRIGFLQDDVDFTSIAAVENIDENPTTGEKTISKSDIFTKRVIDKQADPKADNTTDAVRVSMNQYGKIDLPFISRLLERNEEDVKQDILQSRTGFVNPETGLVEERNKYLSGNVREKLSIAEQANQEGDFDSNIEELSKVIPADIPINLIKMTLGSTWIPTKVYDDFFKETFEIKAAIKKTSADKFISNLYGSGNAKDRQMGMPGANGSTLALNAMNNTTTTITKTEWREGRRVTVTDPIATAQAAAKQTELSEVFESWLKQKKEYAEELENIYNNVFNAVVGQKIDVSSFDRFPGTGGRVVEIEKVKLPDGTEISQFRFAKENTPSDNENVIEAARKYKVAYNEKEGTFATDSNKAASDFAKEANGSAKMLRQHQKEGVLRGLEGATLLAHEVGTGKTLTLITTAMEMRRLGLAKKPVIVVQRSTYKQFVKEIKNQYPNAKVLAPSSKDLTAKQRQQLFAKMAYNDWDIIVLYHSYLDSIPDDPKRVAQYIDEKIQEKMDLINEMENAKGEGSNAGRMLGALKKEVKRLESERDDLLNPENEDEESGRKGKRKRSVKDIEKSRSNAEARAEAALDRRTDNSLNFEQLGVDALLVDEAHAYKKLGFVTSLQRVKGIDTAESKRAQSTRLKSSYILENHNGKNVIFATGTPISNTMAEMWTFLRYLLPKTEMSRLQMNNFDAFVNNFGSIEESAEFGTNGKFRITNRFSSYSNVPELISTWRQVAHTVLTEDVSTLREGVGTPRVKNGKPTDIMLEQTSPLKAVMKGIKKKLEEFDKMTGAQKKENSHIPLVMFGLAKRAAIDVRLVDPNLPDDPKSKTNRAVEEILNDLEATSGYNGSIAIFCDSYQSSDKIFNVFGDIKQKLVENGIKPEQIAIINDYERDDAKERLFTAVNAGEVRVVMGTTEKLGVGVNIQERLHMAIHMDAPLRPSDYQQRNGRIIRQGNTHLYMDKTVDILRIGVQKTLDVTGYQRLEIKKKFIDQIMKGDVSQRMLEESDIESTDSNNFNQMMANLSGSQAALALSIEQNKLKKLQNALQYHEDNQIFISDAVKRARNVIAETGRAIEKLEKYKSDVQKIAGEKVTSIAVGNATANTPEEIESLLNKNITKKIDVEVEALRNDFTREFSTLKTSLLVNGIKVNIRADIHRHFDAATKKTRVTREITYTSPDVSVDNPYFMRKDQLQKQHNTESIPVFDDTAGANIMNMIGQIEYQLAGHDVNSEIRKRKIGVDKAERDISVYEPQIGQDFPKLKELEATERKVAELEVKMKEELQAIEEEEANESIEAANIDNIISNDEDVLFRSADSMTNELEAESREFEIAQAIGEIASSLNTSVRIVRSVSDVDAEGSGRKRTSKGWHNPTTEETVIVLPNNTSVADAQATVLHEVVGHKGLRGLLGDRFDSTMTDIFNSLPEDVQAEYMKRYKDEVKAAEEYAAEMAETMSESTVIQKIVSTVRRVLRSMGIELKMSNGDIMHLLWRSRNRLESHVTSFEEMDHIRREERVKSATSEYDIVFRAGDVLDRVPIPENEKQKIRSRVTATQQTLYEGYVDRMLAVRELQERIVDQTGKPLPDHMNVYMYENTLTSRNTFEMSEFTEKRVKPLKVAIKKLVQAGLHEEVIKNYVRAKHGLERNEYMRLHQLRGAIEQIEDENLRTILLGEIAGKNFSEIEALSVEAYNNMYSELADRDFAGITAVQEELGEDITIEEFIKDVEDTHGALIDDLWMRIRAVNDFSLRKWFDSGMISRETYEKISNMYQHYVPLRGFSEVEAHDVYEYFTQSDIPYNNPTKTAKGRKSKSDDPFPHMLSMAETSIVGGNKNMMKLHLYRLAQVDPSGIITVNHQWYVKIGEGMDGQPEYEVAYPEYNDNIEQYRKNIEDFNAEMVRLESEGLAFSKRKRLNVGYRISKKEANEHVVNVRLNGEEYQVLFHGSPKAAQAINGLNQVQIDNKFMRAVEWANRQMSANFTTRNPSFVASNLSRDVIWATSTLGVKEGRKYRSKFIRNIPKASGALARRIRGKQDMSNTADVMLQEFLENGGRTGYTALYGVEKYRKELEQSLQSGKWAKTKNGYNAVLDFMQLPNEWAEDLSRFSTYMTSREEGRTILRSTSDAKEVTVNFNRKGSGARGANFFKGLYIFFNAAVQGLNNFNGMFRKNPKGAAALVTEYAAMGAIVPLLISMLGDDDDLEKYNGLPDYVRKNNFCIPLGWLGIDGFLKVPLPIELRAIYGLGDTAYQVIAGNDEPLDGLTAGVLGFMDLLPLNPVGGSSNWIPASVKPVFESYVYNEDFTGKPIAKITPFNVYAPEYQRVYRSTSVIPIKVSQLFNYISGGDDVERGAIDNTLSSIGFKVSLSNPAAAEHLFEGYLGGMFTTANQTFKTAIGAPLGLNEFQWRGVPVVNRFFDTGEVDGTMMKVNQKYFDYLDEMKESKYILRGYEKAAEEGTWEDEARAASFESSDRMRRAEYIEEMASVVEDLSQEAEDVGDKAIKKDIQQDINSIKKEMVETLKNGKAPE